MKDIDSFFATKLTREDMIAGKAVCNGKIS